jgi:hypothetical protein
MPVQNPNAPKPSGFSPVMSAESHDRPSVADHVLSQVNHAVAAQPAASTDRKQKSSKKAAAGQPKPVLETALLVTGCLVACAVVAVFFQR